MLTPHLAKASPILHLRQFPRRPAALFVGAACALIGLSCAYAEDDAAIVVRGERSRPASRTPASVDILGATELSDAKIESLPDLQQRLPGLAVSKSVSAFSQPYIRGHGTDIESVGVENSVALYVDGVYQTRPMDEWLRFIDVERVEVFKGPQSVVFADGATAGAINLVSRAPSREGEAQFDAQLASHRQQTARGTVSGALSEGPVYGRLSMLYAHDEGDTENGLLHRKVNGSDVRGLRGALEFAPHAAFDLTLDARYLDKHFAPTAKPLYPTASPVFAFGATVIADPRTVMQDQVSDVQITQSALSATARWKFDTSQLTSVTAWHKTDYAARRGDLDGTELPLVQVGSVTDGLGLVTRSAFFSEDITLASNHAPTLPWLATLAYRHEKADMLGWTYSYPLTSLAVNSTAAVTSNTLALGGQATWSPLERWRITGGARITSVEKNLDSQHSYVNGNPVAASNGNKRWSAVTPKLVVDYSPDKRAMFYASVAKGFKAGGFNSFWPQPGFDQETSVNYEAGVKGNWLNGALTAGLAAFDTHYRNMQVAVDINNGGIIQSIIQNASRATSRGIEANVAGKPSERLLVSASVQVMRARYQEFLTVDPHAPAAGIVDQKDNPLTRAPDRTATVSAQYTWPVQDGGGEVRLRGDGVYRSRSHFTPFKSDYASSPSAPVLNASLSYESLHQRGWYGSLFVKNMTNRTYMGSVVDTPRLGYLAYVAPGRSAGVQAGYRY